MRVEFELLGAVTVRVGGDEVDAGHARQLCVLACLALEANRPVRAEQLLERVWADHPPQRAGGTLPGYISRLRRVLLGTGEVAIRRRPEGYVLAVDPMAVDVYRFHDLTARARLCANGEQACELYGQALALWRGEAFAGMDTPWLNEIRVSLDAQRLAAELDYYDLALGQGKHGELVSVMSERAQGHPLDERLAGQLLLALYRCGRQADALQHYEQVRLRLAEELGADPGPALQQRHAAILRQSSELDLPARTTPNNLAVPLSSFIGRNAELAELYAALAAGRLVTLTGVGGAGKSRLALEMARSSLQDYPDGIWLVELAAIMQPGLVSHVVAAVLGVVEDPARALTDLLADRLRTTRTLLVLDNCEHLIGEVADLAGHLLARCAGLRILVTSRERLGVTGEVLRPVGGLAVPLHRGVDPAVLETVDAVRLLVDRAAGVDARFRLTSATAGAVAQICRRLDGLPLAIELAAASLNALGVEEIAGLLDDRFRVLTHGGRTALARHQTLQAAIDWSYDMLSADHRRLFNRLAVFVGGCTHDAIEAVCCDAGDDPLALLAHLIDASLIVAETGAGPTRYRMLETLRAYGLQRLDECGEMVLLGDRHAAYVLALAERADMSLHGCEQPQRLRLLETEHGNIRAALVWSHEHGDADTASRIAGLLQQLWDRHGHYTEGANWINRVLAMGGLLPTGAPAQTLDSTSRPAVAQGDLEQAEAASWQATALGEHAADIAGITHALEDLGRAALHAGDVDRCAALMQTALQHARAVGDEVLQAQSLLFPAWTAMVCGEYRQAIALLTEFETRLGTDGDPEWLAWALLIRSAATRQEGNHGEATKLLADSIYMFQDQKHEWGLSVALSLAARRARIDGDDTRMVLLLAASERMRESAGAAVLSPFQPWMDELVTHGQTVFGAQRFDRTWRTGQALTLDATLALALPDVLT